MRREYLFVIIILRIFTRFFKFSLINYESLIKNSNISPYRLHIFHISQLIKMIISKSNKEEILILTNILSNILKLKNSKVNCERCHKIKDPVVYRCGGQSR